MAEAEQKEQQRPSATLTISEQEHGTAIHIEFSQPYRSGNPEVAHALALMAMDYIRKYLKEHFQATGEDIKVVPAMSQSTH